MYSALFMHHIQMVSLYKDPKGTEVFGKSGPSVADRIEKTNSFEQHEKRAPENAQVDSKGACMHACIEYPIMH